MTHALEVLAVVVGWAWVICVAALIGIWLLLVVLARIKAARSRRVRERIPEPVSWRHRRRAGFREHLPTERQKAERAFFLMSGGR